MEILETSLSKPINRHVCGNLIRIQKDGCYWQFSYRAKRIITVIRTQIKGALILEQQSISQFVDETRPWLTEKLLFAQYVKTEFGLVEVISRANSCSISYQVL